MSESLTQKMKIAKTHAAATLGDPHGRDDPRRAIVLDVPRFEQPDDETCGPTCLANVYHYYGLDKPIDEIIGETRFVRGGGTVAVYLGQNALKNGFAATIYPFGLDVFDPTWRGLAAAGLADKLRARRAALTPGSPKLRHVIQGYVDFLESGGEVEFSELTAGLIHRLIVAGRPILTGLCATYLYGTARVRDGLHDDVAGTPEGHFVVVCGSAPGSGEVVLRDPSRHIPFSRDGRYSLDTDRLIRAILMGDSTYDAVFLTVFPEAA